MINGIDLLLSCKTLRRLIVANRKKTSVVRMKFSKETDEYSFEIISSPAMQSLPAGEKVKLEKFRPDVKRVLDHLQREVETLALANGLEIFLRLVPGFGCDRRTYRPYRPVPKSGFSASAKREIFETFDDGRSVWTLPSNWKNAPEKE